MFGDDNMAFQNYMHSNYMSDILAWQYQRLQSFIFFTQTRISAIYVYKDYMQLLRMLLDTV